MIASQQPTKDEKPLIAYLHNTMYILVRNTRLFIEKIKHNGKNEKLPSDTHIHGLGLIFSHAHLTMC